MKKNDFAELFITDTDKNGNGIARAENGLAVFVRNTCAGDKVLAKIIKITKSYAVAIPEEIIQPSADRIAGGCAVSGKCGGCAFQHISYEAECRFKAKGIDAAFERIGKLDIRLSAFHAAKDTRNYRNKAIYPVGKDKDGKAYSGFFARMSHRIIEHDECNIAYGLFPSIRDSLLEYVNKRNIPPYDEEARTGVLRSIYMRKAENGSVILTLILNTAELISKEEEALFCEYIKSKHPEIVSVLVNINTKTSNAVLGPSFRILLGDGYLYDELCGKKFRISPASFYQVNHAQTEVLYGIAKRFANLSSGETLLDLYCGTGTVGICIAEPDTKLIGVEIVPEAAKDADFNAKANGLDAKFLCLDAENALDDEKLITLKPDVITIDPPRKGCGEKAARKIASLGASRIVYISCDPATLARDLAVFEECGYRAQAAEGVDMFARTGHCEVVCALQRQLRSDINSYGNL